MPVLTDWVPVVHTHVHVRALSAMCGATPFVLEDAELRCGNRFQYDVSITRASGYAPAATREEINLQYWRNML